MTMLRWRSFVLGSATAAWLTLISGGFSQTNFGLSITAANSPAIVSLGQYFTSGFTVATTGSDPAQNVVVRNRVPANLQFVSARSTRGTCAYAAGDFTCTNQPTIMNDPSPPSGESYYRLTRGTGN